MADSKQPMLSHNQPEQANGFGPSSSARTSFASADHAAVQRTLKAIQDAGSRNTELLQEVSSTAHAPPELANHRAQAESVADRLKDQQAETMSAIALTDAQLKRHESLRDSSARRLVYTLVSKKEDFLNKAQKEEKTYHEALEKRRKAEMQLAELERSHATLLEEIKTLEQLVERHGAAHGAVDSLYSSLFDGPTPGFPDEDAQETKLWQAKRNHADRTAELKAVVAGVKAAQAIKTAVDRAIAETNQEGVNKLNAMRRCGRYTTRALDLNDSAVEQIPPHLLHSDIVQSKLKMKELLQSAHKISSSAKVQDLIQIRRGSTPSVPQQTGEALSFALTEHENYMKNMKQASESARAAIRSSARALEDARQGLQQIRQGAFEKTLGFGAAAPAYHECCDRAEGFENESDAQCLTVPEPVVEVLSVDEPPPPGYFGDQQATFLNDSTGEQRETVRN